VRYTTKSNIFIQGGANTFSYDDAFISLYDFYGGYNYSIIKNTLTGYGQVEYYHNNPKSENLKSSLLYGYEANIQYQNPVITTAITWTADYGQSSTIHDFSGVLSLSHDFYLNYDPDEGAFSITPSVDIYLGSIGSTNIERGKTVKQLIKKYGRKNYKSHLNELQVIQNYNSGFGFLYDFSALYFTYERRKWSATAVTGWAQPYKAAPLPQTASVNRFLFSLSLGYIFD
jgi:hypothetical protein